MDTQDVPAHIAIDLAKVTSLCKKYRVQRMSLFGSVVRDDFDEASDVDVLVEFEPGQTPGLDFFTFEAELSELFGRRVDLNTPGFLSPPILERALAEAQTIYAQP